MPMPSTANACERMPIVCFAPECTGTGGAGNIASEVCLEYTNGRVYVSSDTTGGAYDLSADAASVAASPNQWHYAELSAQPSIAPPEAGTDT